MYYSDGIGAVGAVNGVNNSYTKRKKGGLNELAMTLGITLSELRKMSESDLTKLADKKGVNLNDYQKPGERPPEIVNAMSMSGSIFNVKRPEFY